MIKKIGIALLAILVIAQFIQPDRSVETAPAEQDFLAMTNAPQEIASKLRMACYDCHSNETIYPWYSKISPVSWWLQNHINEGREELNFSIWGTYSAKKKNHKLEEGAEALVDGWIPLDSYTWIHRNADLSPEDRDRLALWLNGLR